jgi:cell division transport system permease protein
MRPLRVIAAVAAVVNVAVSLLLVAVAGYQYLQVAKIERKYERVAPYTIWLDLAVTDEQRTKLRTALQRDPAVKAIAYQSREQAYERFKRQFKDNPDLVNATRPEDLPESFRVTLTEPDPDGDFKRRYEHLPGVETVTDNLAPVRKITAPHQRAARNFLIGAGAAMLLGIGLVAAAVLIRPRDR